MLLSEYKAVKVKFILLNLQERCLEVLAMALLHAPEKWDGEADVSVVGSGNAGLPAAITATEGRDKS